MKDNYKTVKGKLPAKLAFLVFSKGGEHMPEKEKARCDKELEQLAMQPDAVVNVVMEVIDREQKTLSSETGIGSIEGGETSFVGESNQEPG